ncbi:MAG TPA: hypothetical protein PKE29_09985 [Phycisphaerales bacterium]|nr:hypothetical protein [Phycisphaerales bacterium]
MPPIDLATVTFSIDDGRLVVRATARGTGRPYRHTCPLESFETVAHELDAAGSQGLTRVDLHERTGIPWTRINVAVLFLYERSIIDRTGRRGRLYVPASATVFEDAMTEYYALREGDQDA